MKKFLKHLLGGTVGAMLALAMSTSAFAAVSVTITGDTDHLPKQHTSYTEWARTSLDYTNGMTAKDAVLTALDQNGFSYYYDSGYNYLFSVTSPFGVTLPGRSNEGYGGWMYDVNGTSPAVGLADMALNDNDNVELYWVDDYRDIYGYGLNVTSNRAEYTLTVYDKNNAEVQDYGYGYSLANGETYTYTAESTDCAPLSGSFTINSSDVSVTLDFVQNGNILTKIIFDTDNTLQAQNAAAENLTAGELIRGLLDLSGLKYDYNADTHYIANVTAENGETFGESTSPYSGWMFSVNGVSPITNIDETSVSAGDTVEFYFLPDYRELWGYGVNFVSNAEDYEVRIFDMDNNQIQPFYGSYSLVNGKYTYTAEKEGYLAANGAFEVNGDSPTVYVDFIKADSVLVKMTAYTADGEKRLFTVEIPENAPAATAKDVILAALGQAGFTYNYEEAYNYLASATAPDGTEYGSASSPYAGLMFSVNTVIGSESMAQTAVKGGDIVELMYVEDYRSIYGYGAEVHTNASQYTLHIYSESGTEMLDYGYGYSLLPGHYSYTIEADGYEKAYGTFDVENDTAVINVKLSPVFRYGDFDLNGKIEADDAANILQKALISTFPAKYDDISYIDVDDNGKIEAADATYVLQKALVSTFELPCEKVIGK